MNRQTYKKRTYKKRINTRKKHINTRKKRINARKKRAYTKRTYRNHPLTPNSNSSIFSVPDKKYSDKIVIDTHHKQSGNIIPGLRTYLGNV
jgi:hypothetical protein